MNNFIFFSNNQNKIKEIKKLFLKSGIKVQSLNDLNKTENYMAKIEPKEIGNSFAANAKIKSLYGFKRFNMPCFADDSGICIDVFGGLPGINSKEFLNSTKNKKQILNKIINEAKNQKNFDAFFMTTICLSLNTNKHFFFHGRIDGKISKEIRGVNGFGYDPIFIPRGKRITFAEMTLEEKNEFSHRTIAIKKLKKFLNKLI